MTLEEIIKKLEEANLVTSATVLRHEDRIREHEEWLRQNELFMARHREATAQHEAMIVKLDEKLDRIAELILKGQSGNGKS